MIRPIQPSFRKCCLEAHNGTGMFKIEQFWEPSGFERRRIGWIICEFAARDYYKSYKLYIYTSVTQREQLLTTALAYELRDSVRHFLCN